MSDYMLVQAVVVEPKGSTLTTAASISDTGLEVENAQDFDDEGGTLDLNGVRLQYTSVVEGANSGDPDIINLADPLAVGAGQDDAVSPVIGGLIPEDWYAVGTMGGEGEEAHVPIDVDQRSQWPVGEYPDPVPVRVSDDLLHLEDAPGRTVSSRSAFRNTDTYVYDGVAADIRLPLTKLPISGSEQPFWMSAGSAVGGLGLPPGTWRIEVPNLIVDDAGLMAEFDTDDLFWVDYAYDAALDDIARPPEGLPYDEEVLADSPYFYWRLGDSSGSTATDSSGNSRNGTYQNSPTLGASSLLASDTTNTAVGFDGVNDYISSSVTNDPTTFTVECWFKASTPVPGGAWLMHRWPTTSSLRTFILEINGSSFPAFTVKNSGGTDLFASSSAANLTDGVAHHLVGTYDGTTIRLYVDGVQVATQALTGPPNATGTSLQAGGRGGIGQFFNGVLDEVAYYTTALSAARIATHYAAGN